MLEIGKYKISPDFFEQGFAPGQGPCLCSSTCCEGGVYADVHERDTIMAHKEIIKEFMDETQSVDDSRWFETNEFEDPDFASGRCIGTQVINDKCAFLDKLGRCSLQVAATAKGMHRWTLKPLFCILYPIEITNKMLAFDDMLQDEQACCTVSNDFQVPLFRACKEELVHLLGEEGYQTMETHFDRLRASVSAIESCEKS